MTRGVLGPRGGLLSAVNAGGAITGAVLAGFYLIGSVGLSRTFMVAAAINLLVGVGAWLLPTRPDGPATERSATASAPLGHAALRPRRARALA